MNNEILNIDGLMVYLWSEGLPHDEKLYQAGLVFDEDGNIHKDRYGLNEAAVRQIISKYHDKEYKKLIEEVSVGTEKPKNKFLILAARKRK